MLAHALLWPHHFEKMLPTSLYKTIHVAVQVEVEIALKTI